MSKARELGTYAGKILQTVQMETDALTSSNSTTYVNTSVTFNRTSGSGTGNKILGSNNLLMLLWVVFLQQ